MNDRIGAYLRAIEQDALDLYYNRKNYSAGKISRKEFIKRKNKINNSKQTTLEVGLVELG